VSSSCIYEGHVTHLRHAPKTNSFRYRLFLIYLDLDELPELFDGVPMWSARRPAPAWFRRQDYLGDPQTPLDEAVRQLVEARLGTRPTGPVRILTNLRYFGYCFNPVTFYWCFDRAGPDARVTHVAAEVTNTPWGERHAYVAPTLRSNHDKGLHVSPFWSMDMRYTLTMPTPGERLGLSIAAERNEHPAFHAGLDLRRREIDAKALTRLLLTRPPMTHKVSAAIYAEGLKLRLRGVRPYPHPRVAA
jgi:DUF1365 family protein